MLVPVYVRLLRPNEFGVLSLLTITLTLTVIVLKCGLDQAFFRHYYDTKDEEHKRRIVGSTLIFLVLSSALATWLLYLIAPQLSDLLFKSSTDRSGLLRLILIIAFFDIVTTIPNAILRAHFRSIKFSALNIISFVVQLSAICYLVIYVDSSVENVLVGRLIGSAFEAAIFFIAVRRELSLRFSSSELREMLAFGSPLIFNQIASTLFIMIDRFFLEHYTREVEVGIYSMASTLVSVVTVIAIMPFGQVWTVMRFSVMNEEGADEYYSRVLTYIVFVSMTLALGVAAVAGDGLQLFGSRGYWPAATIIPLLGLSAVLDSASRVLNIGLTLKKRTIYAPVVMFAALAINVALNFLLIPDYGVMGATISTLISYVIFCALRYWASNLFFKVNYEWKRIAMILAVGALMVIIFYCVDYLRGDLKEYRFEDPVRRMKLYFSITFKALLAISFPLILLALRFYDERERRRISEIWQKIAFVLKHRKWTEA